MSDVVAQVRAGDLSFLSKEALAEWMVTQRWFASKARHVSELEILETGPIAGGEPLLTLALVAVRFHAGTHELYQVPLGLRHVDEGWDRGVIATVEDRVVYDALLDDACASRLVELIRDGATLERDDAVWCFEATGELPSHERLADVHLIEAEQSNSSLVFGDEVILKFYRRIEPGPNPELELLRFLTGHGFENIARLAGWYEHTGRLVDATLGVLQQFLKGGRDGWELALDALAEGRADAFNADLAQLGEITARMHSILGSDMSDPTFAPEEPSAEFLGLLLATVDEEIERIFRDVPDVPEVAPIAGRAQEVREQLRGLAHVGAGGRVIRTHGDYHLGQALLADGRWAILDFEGEPARSLTQRRQKRSPLRDVAGMLRSFAYVASGAERLRGVAVPPDWEQQARAAFLDAYFGAVDQALLPHGHDNVARMLSIFELEKAVYELRYEMNNRPDWISIPVDGIARLLEEGG
jgi:trehalose synthase-fused probable maltokinase